MTALSIRQPWAWLIIHGGKDIENRTWYSSFRGRFLVHASKGMTKDEYYDAFDLVRHYNIVIPPFSELERGGIIGSVEMIDCTKISSSRWFFGRWGFVLRDPAPLPFRPYTGSLGFFGVNNA